MDTMDMFIIYLVGIILVSIPNLLFQREIFRCTLRKKWGLSLAPSSKFDELAAHTVCGDHKCLKRSAMISIPLLLCSIGLLFWPNILHTPSSRYAIPLILSILVLNIFMPLVRLCVERWADPVEKAMDFIRRYEQRPQDGIHNTELQTLLSRLDMTGEVFRTAYAKLNEDQNTLDSEPIG